MLKRFLAALFGNFIWTAPPWLTRTVHATRRHRARSFLLLLLLLLLISGGWFGWKWYERQPKPVRITAIADPIPVTRLEKELKPAPLTIRFSGSVAKLEQVGKVVNSGVHLEPSAEGKWSWTSDSALTFKPKRDWPADQKYRVTFEKTFFPHHIHLERDNVELTTPSFTGTIKEIEFYQDPKTPAIRQVVATLEFSHSVDRADLEKHVALAMIGGSDVFASKSGPRFTATYGLHDRLAYIRSIPLTLPEHEDFMKLTLSRGLTTTQGGAQTVDDNEKKVSVPDIYSFFKIESASGSVVRTSDGDPEQVLIIDTTAAAKSEEIRKALHVYLLPKRAAAETEEAADSPNESAENNNDSAENDGDTEEEKSESTPTPTPSSWQSAREVDDDVLKNSRPVEITVIPSEHEQSQVHAFKFSVPEEGSLYVRIDKGVKAVGDFPLQNDYDAIVAVPDLPREIAIEGKGGILALSGERKLSIKSRGLGQIEYEIARVASNQINHLVTQTNGGFENPEFVGEFDEENISRIAVEHQPINLTNKFQANFSAFDFSSHLQLPNDGGTERGLFFVSAREWDPVKKKAVPNPSDRRFILVTDLGILVKKNADKSSDVFVMSLKTGAPLGNVAVQILGKNGVALTSGTTSPDGRVNFLSLGDPEREKRPVAFVARLGNDVSFMPYARSDRALDFSRFDIDGVENISPDQLEAFVFTERGVYRPGDEVHIGCIVKQRSWQGKLEGMPVEVEVFDARDARAQVRQLRLPAKGFAELNFQTANESPTGAYRVEVYLVRNGKRDALLGNGEFHVEEFLPDRMKIESHLSKEPAHGWIDPKDVQAFVTLRNLYGTPASARRVASKLELSPANFSFSEFKDYSFHDPLRDDQKEHTTQTVDLGDLTTNDEGKVTVPLNLERFADATYEMNFSTEGFEADGGRSVHAYNSLLVSALPRVIGYKPDAPLDYLQKNSAHTIDFIAVDRGLNKVATENLKFDLIERTYVSVLAKKDNGNYAYESVLKERPVKTDSVSIAASGFSYALPTSAPGNFVLEIKDDSGRLWNRLSFSVVGLGEVSRSLAKNSELEVKLAKSSYNAGDEIEIAVTAPYTGSGLITIESDKVYAHQWFTSNTTSSLQHIRVPEGFDGTGYVNVSFVRALDSKEVFTSPLSYAVVPLTVNKEKRRLQISLTSKGLARPGEPLKIVYKTDRPSKIVIFAVDKGILQVTDFKTPDPLEYFFRKSALSVETSQIVDLILPEFSILRAASAAGGDGDAEMRLNPFKRVTDKPVVFWSGIVDADSTEHEVTYEVPDYFDGALQIMAVAFAGDATGAAEKEATIRGPFVITPSVPTMVAPNDQFEVGVTVANNVTGSSENAEIALTVESSAQLEIVKAPPMPLRISEGREDTVTFSVRAKNELGAASLAFHAIASGNATTRRATLSVRPAVPFMTQVRSGNFAGGSKQVPIDRQMHTEFRQLSATVSALPLGLARGLDFYLKNFPHGCTEQITSAAFVRLLLAGEADFGLTHAEIEDQLENEFAMLRRRQNDQGAFGYWTAETSPESDFVSVYATHFLSEAKAAGFAPPPDILQSALRNLQTMVARQPRDLADARTIAYAIYVLTREGFITTNYILNLRDYLDKQFEKQWPQDLTGVYLAGAWSLLKKDDEANRLIAAYRIGQHDASERTDFYQPLGADAQYLALVARHFPARLTSISVRDFQAITRPIGAGDFNTLSAAYAVWALKSYSQSMSGHLPETSIAEISRDKHETPVSTTGTSVKSATFSPDAAALQFATKGPSAAMGIFYQVIEAGFDRELPRNALTNGLEVYRELVDAKGTRLEQVTLGEPVTVKLSVRSLTSDSFTNVAIIDLLPGGFEILRDTARNGNHCDYVDLREDRALFYSLITPRVTTITYQIKPTNRGEFIVPPPYAESMYERGVNGRGVAGKITVVDAK
ncbi:MAG: alpha-2-macroglobulin [Chthoniobacterales bacterium]|nr:alpha-2-macroglobulin [Chthoniobacterales bacterium]